MSVMRLVVFGISGPTGRLLAEGALKRGHRVTALSGAAGELGSLRGHVRGVHGSVLDGGAVSDAVDGQEAVLVALADAQSGRKPAIAQGTLNVIRSMQRYGVRRLVVLSGAGAQPGNDANLPWFHERIVKPLFLRRQHAELRRMETTVRQSELDWTLGTRREPGRRPGPRRVPDRAGLLAAGRHQDRSCRSRRVHARRARTSR